jgi:hypothetical protein
MDAIYTIRKTEGITGLYRVKYNNNKIILINI